MIVNIVGLGSGPTAVALVTDYIFKDPAQIRYSLASVLPASILIAMLFAGLAGRKYRAAYDAARGHQNDGAGPSPDIPGLQPDPA
jgi:hypothetical protein